MAISDYFKSFESSQYLDIGTGQPIILLHGLFGSLSNFEKLIEYLSKTNRVLMPILPLFSFSVKDTHLESLLKYLQNWLKFLDVSNYIILGNSMGGHLGLMLVLQPNTSCQKLVLTASSGLFENGLGNSYPRRDLAFIKKKVEETFGNPDFATPELVNEVYNIVNNNEKAIRIIKLAKSATRNNLQSQLNKIKIPTLLIWGDKDTITPPFVAQQFKSILPNALLHILPGVGHAPMMEAPEAFYNHLNDFLSS